MTTSPLAHGDGQPSLCVPLMPVEDAVRVALAAYLAGVDWYIHPGRPGLDELSRARTFRLTEVLTDFPGPGVVLKYPIASIAETTPMVRDGGFTPSALEDTYDPVAETVVWRLGRAEGTLQLDFWADNLPVRASFLGQLDGLFTPNESMSGVHLTLPPEYACAVARYTLIGVQRVDPPDAVWANERRLQASVRVEAPVLERRRARAFRPQTRLTVT